MYKRILLAIAAFALSMTAQAIDWTNMKNLGNVHATVTVDWSQTRFQKFTQIDATNTTVTFKDPGSPGPVWLIVQAPPAGTLPTLTWPSNAPGTPPDAGFLGNTMVMEFFFDGTKYTYYYSVPELSAAFGNNGHLVNVGTKPVVTTGAADCGTGPITSVGNDYAGRVTVGTSTNGGKCTLTFATAWATAPACQCTNESAVQLCRAIVAVDKLTVALTGTLVAGNLLTYECTGFK